MYGIMQGLSQIDGEHYFRTRDQITIQHKIINGLLPFIFKSRFKEFEKEIKDHWGIESIDQTLLVTMPRRAGKTEAIAQLIAVLLMNVPDIHISAFAPSTRAAGGESGLISHVARILEKCFGQKRFFKKTDESLFIRGGAGDIRKFFAYPGGATDKCVLILALARVHHRGVYHACERWNLPTLCGVCRSFFSRSKTERKRTRRGHCELHLGSAH
jgi:hypothetical protein